MWDMYSEKNVDVFRFEHWKNVNEVAVSMATAYNKTKASKSVKVLSMYPSLPYEERWYWKTSPLSPFVF